MLPQDSQRDIYSFGLYHPHPVQVRHVRINYHRFLLPTRRPTPHHTTLSQHLQAAMVEGGAALFHVFQGAPAGDSQLLARRGDQVPSALALGAASAAPAATDRHLRELAQLEVRVKALQLQAQQSAAPRATARALAGALAECLRFYARLLTAEAFVWPDFLAALFAKLAEHFAASDSVHVKSAVLEVFVNAPAHVAQVNDSAKVRGGGSLLGCAQIDTNLRCGDGVNDAGSCSRA